MKNNFNQHSARHQKIFKDYATIVEIYLAPHKVYSESDSVTGPAQQLVDSFKKTPEEIRDFFFAELDKEKIPYEVLNATDETLSFAVSKYNRERIGVFIADLQSKPLAPTTKKSFATFSLMSEGHCISTQLIEPPFRKLYEMGKDILNPKDFKRRSDVKKIMKRLDGLTK